MEENIALLEVKLKERRELFDKRSTLSLFISVSNSISKIENLLSILQQQRANKDGENTEDSKTIISNKTKEREEEESSNIIERIASEFNQLKYFVSRISTFPFASNIEPVHSIMTYTNFSEDIVH